MVPDSTQLAAPEEKLKAKLLREASEKAILMELAKMHNNPIKALV